MRKILVVITTEYVPFGGLTTVMMNYYRAINKRKYIVDFASTNIRVDDKLENEIKQYRSNYFYLGNRKYNPISYGRTLYKLLKNGDYHAIHVNANSATAAIELTAAKIAGIPIRIDHNHTSLCDHKCLHFMMLPLFKKSYTDAISCSDKAGKWLFGQGKYFVLNNGIDTAKYAFDAYKRKSIRDSLGIDETVLVVGHVGKIYRPKNHVFILNVFKDYCKTNDNSILLLVGDGELKNQMMNLAEEFKIQDKVVFTGMQADIPAFLSAMDIFIFPSLWEGLPLSLVEAQASGIKCIASDAIDAAANVTGNVKMLPIDRGTELWVEEIKKTEINNRITNSKENIKLLVNNGYDTRSNVELLEQIYDK